MEKLTRKKEQTLASLKTLEESMYIFSELTKDDRCYGGMRDSVIKRFEYSIDTFWKFLKIYLEEKHGIIPPATPKGIFKVALDAQVISPAEEDELRLLIENRNLTSHGYNLELSISIADVIPAHYQVLKTIMHRLSSE
jgi:uncharacterized protein YutE (UPF0331/DUF86 family)